MIHPDGKRIAGMHVSHDGNIAVVWLSVDTQINDVFIYDSALFKREVAVVVADSITARGRNIPVAWANKPIADQLKDKGCNMVLEPCDESNPFAEMMTRELWERIRTKRLRVDKRLGDVIQEIKTLERGDDGNIPTDSHPLAAATRNALEKIKFARRLQPKRTHRKQSRKVAIV